MTTPCVQCKGSGKNHIFPDNSYTRCPTCKGSGIPAAMFQRRSINQNRQQQQRKQSVLINISSGEDAFV